MTKRRRLLIIVALALLGTDAINLSAFYKRHFAYNATVTYAGIDSLGMLVPAGMRPAKFQGGKWDVDPIPTLNVAMFEAHNDARTTPIALISLSPQSTYGKALEVFRTLKASKVCNVLIREGGRMEPVTVDFPDGPDKAISIPALVLCGSSVGDAGFYGVLPTDRPVHVNHDLSTFF